MLDARARNLLCTFKDENFRQVDPMDFTSLIFLQERGYVVVHLNAGKISAARTFAGKQLFDRIWGSR